MAHVIDITDDNFETEVLASELPFFVDLSAQWCGPCKTIAPIVDELAAEYEGKIRFGKVDIDVNPQITVRYQVRSVPTLLMFKNGSVVGQLIGAHPKTRIVELLNNAS